MMTAVQKKANRTQRDDLTGEHVIGDAGQLIFFILFMIIWLGDSFYFGYTTFLNSYIPPIIKIPLSVIFLIASGYLCIKGLLIVFYERREKPYVIRKNVFNIVRHPIYLGEILFYLGLLMISISIAAVFFLIVIFYFLQYISKFEEMLLIKRFGAEYQGYQHEVPMLIPSFKRIWN